MSRGETLVLVMPPAQDRPTHDLALAPGRCPWPPVVRSPQFERLVRSHGVGVRDVLPQHQSPVPLIHDDQMVGDIRA